jgi:hypothetical protein
MTKRTSISKSKRFGIFKRDGFKCQYCGATPPTVILHLDHIHPVSKGGTNAEENLVTSCSNCNLGKSTNLLNSVPKSLKEKATEVAEAEEQLRAYGEVFQSQSDRIERDAWDILQELRLVDNGQAYTSQLTSAKTFIKRLPKHELLEAAEIALSKFIRKSEARKRFQYFCGICWNKIKREGEQHG